MPSGCPIKRTKPRLLGVNETRPGAEVLKQGFGRDRTKTYLLGGADPGNVVTVSQTYNQHRGVAHTAAMPEGLAEFFIKAASPAGSIVIDPFAGGATDHCRGTSTRPSGRGLRNPSAVRGEALRRIEADLADDIPGQLVIPAWADL